MKIGTFLLFNTELISPGAVLRNKFNIPKLSKNKFVHISHENSRQKLQSTHLFDCPALGLSTPWACCTFLKEHTPILTHVCSQFRVTISLACMPLDQEVSKNWCPRHTKGQAKISRHICLSVDNSFCMIWNTISSSHLSNNDSTVNMKSNNHTAQQDSCSVNYLCFAPHKVIFLTALQMLPFLLCLSPFKVC